MLAEQHVFSSMGGGRTFIIDVCIKVLQCLEQYFLDFSRLVCVTTDGAPAMIGQKKGAASLLARHCEAAGHTQPIHKRHRIIHQEAKGAATRYDSTARSLPITLYMGQS